ncbi:MAG: hypothetical protein ABI743_06730, partial [bacterium]
MLSSSSRNAGLAAGLWALLALLGCQGGDATTPSPAQTPARGPVTVRPAVSLLGPESPDALAMLGLYDLSIDSNGSTASLTPARDVQAVGDAYSLDLTGGFTTSAFGCASCLALDGFKLETINSQQVVTLGFTARHPFQVAATANRADLHINNVRLLFLLDGTDSFFSGADAVTTNANGMYNADGLVALPPTFVAPPAGSTATLFPFKVFETGDNMVTPTGNFDSTNGWNDNTGDPQGYNVLKMGGVATTKAQFVLPTGGSLAFGGRVALLGNFIVSAANKAARQNPIYYMPEGAMPEAWHVRVVAPSSFTAAATSELDNLNVRVSDWQQGATVDAGFPNPANLLGVKADGSVAAVAVSIPGFSATPFGPVTAPNSGTGTFADPLSYNIPVTKPASVTTPGDYFVLVKVTDARTNLTALKSDLTTPDSLAIIATYQTATITILPGNVAPACGGYTINGAPAGAFQLAFASNAPTVIACDFTNDPDGTIIAADFDWAYDGVTFNVMDTLAVAGSKSHVLSGAGTVGIRFTDDDSAQTICTSTFTTYAPTTTPAGSTAYIGPSQFTNVSANGSDMSVARISTQMVSYGNTVYALCKQDLSSATVGTSYIARSIDGGTTWNAANNIQLCPFANSAAGALANLKFNAVGMCLNADGSALCVVAINSTGGTSAGNVVISRINTSSFTLDAVIRGVALEDATNTVGYDSTFNGFEVGVVAHPTDPEKLFVFSDDTTTRMIRLCKIGNFKSATTAGYNVAGSITLARAATTGNAMQVDGVTATSIFDPVAYTEPSLQQIHIVGEGGGGIPATGYESYRKYLIASDTFEGATETQFVMAETGQAEREPGVVAWTDGKPIVVTRSDGAAGFD